MKIFLSSFPGKTLKIFLSLGENNTIVDLDISWCSVRLTGTTALAKAMGDNNHLRKLNLSNNRFSNETLEILIRSVQRNVILEEIDLSSNQFIIRFEPSYEKNPAPIITGSESLLYKLFLVASTNQNLKIFRVKSIFRVFIAK